MPVTASAKKALRKDQRRELRNKSIRSRIHAVLRKALEDPSPENISVAYSIFDRAVKKHVIHKNKAARLKSRIQRTTSENKK